MDGILDWVVPAAILAASAVLALWTAGAIYYDLCGGAKWGRVVAVCWVLGVAVLFSLWQPPWKPFLVLLGAVAIFLTWWLRLRPSHDREWEPSVAVLPRASQDGDVVTIENVRNFEYRSLKDLTPRYETRAFHLSNLRGVDAIFFNWGMPWMSHPVAVFDFGPDGRVCISVEVRYRKGQDYSVVRSLYRQHELIILVADERDVILRRTKHTSNQTAYLYPLVVGVDGLRALFLDYVGAINDLYQAPRWYHGLLTNCTTTVWRLPHTRHGLDWRILANGWLDRSMYEVGWFDRSLPFDELRRVSLINDIANAGPAEGFGDHLRRELERRRQAAAK